MESADNILQASAWHNVVLTYENESIKLYVDGQVVASNLTDTIDLNPTGLLENFVVGSNMTGCVDEIQFYNKVLTTEEVGHIAYEGNYSATLANYDLKFNELTVEPTQVIDSKTGARYNTSNANYEDGFVEGSKSIRFTNGGDVSLGNVDLSQKNAVSISTWVNLDALTNTGQTIVKKDGVIDMSIDNKDIKLTLGSTPILFTLTNPTAPMLSDEKFSFSDPTTAFNGTRLESYESGASSTNTIPAFYTNQMTISSWVKTSNTTKQNIISVGENVHVGLNNNNTIECDVDKLNGLATTTIGVSSFNIENANYSGDIFNSVGVGTDSIDFDVASPNSLQTYKLKRFTFGVPFRNYAPTSVSIVGVNGSTETTLVTYPISFKNSNHVYDIVIDDTNAAIDNNKIKVKFNGSGALKVKNVGVETTVEDSITTSITSSENSVTISGNVSRPGTLKVHSSEGTTIAYDAEYDFSSGIPSAFTVTEATYDATEQAVSFDKTGTTGKRMTVDTSSILTSNFFTVSFDVKFNELSSTLTEYWWGLGNVTSGTYSDYIRLWYNNGRLRVQMGSVEALGPVTLPTKEYMRMTIINANTIPYQRVYINGVKVNFTTDTNGELKNAFANKTMYFGNADGQSSFGKDGTLNGFIKNIEIFDRVLSDAEVTTSVNYATQKRNGLNIERTTNNLVASTTINADTSFEVIFSDTRPSGIYNYYLSVENGNSITKFDGLGLSAYIFINYINIDTTDSRNYVYVDKTDSRSAIQYFTFTRDAYYSLEMQTGDGQSIGSHHFSVGNSVGGTGVKLKADIFLEKGNYIILTNFMGQNGYWQDHGNSQPGGAAALIKADSYDDVTNSTKESQVVIFLGGPGSGGHCSRHASYKGGHPASSSSGSNSQPFGTQYTDDGPSNSISFYTDSAQGGGGKSPNPNTNFTGSGHNGYSRTGKGHATLGNSVPSPFGGGATQNGHNDFYSGSGGFGFFGGITGGNSGGGGAGSHYWSPTLLKYTTKFGKTPTLHHSGVSGKPSGGYVKLTEIIYHP